MDSAKPDLIAKIKAANTVLVTVSRDPSIDQLAACIGMALIVAKLKKHGTAVFSGEVPSTIEFLKPEDTLEKNTDSLRDFIIALDKNKADKLRYKVEDQMVKIFITPYRTSLNEDDLEFSQGELNVDLVITLGVENNDDLDQAIMASGNILHDATIVSINTTNPSTLGSINWNVPQASSLCELVADLAGALGDKLVDAQIATALLTGIVAETNRFSNDKTTSLTMSISSELMAAGANQQLVATELSTQEEHSSDNAQPEDSLVVNKEDGELDISHLLEENSESDSPDATLPTPTPDDDDKKDSNNLTMPEQSGDDLGASQPPKVVAKPPELGGTLNANSTVPEEEKSSDPLSSDNGVSANNYLMDKPSTGVSSLGTAQNDQSDSSQPGGSQAYTPPPPSWVPPLPDRDMQQKVDIDLSDPASTISSLEKTVDSPHASDNQLASARHSVKSASDQPAAQTPALPPVDDTMDATFKFPDELDPAQLKPPSAPPYPPPITTPPADSNASGQDTPT